jgi:hypothetical protein
MELQSHSKTSKRGQHILAEAISEVLCCDGGLERVMDPKGSVQRRSRTGGGEGGARGC